MNKILQTLKTIKEIKANCIRYSSCDKCQFHIGIFGDEAEGCIFKRGVPCNWVGENLLISYYENKEGID